MHRLLFSLSTFLAVICFVSGCAHTVSLEDKSKTAAVTDVATIRAYLLAGSDGKPLLVEYTETERNLFIDNKVMLVNIKFEDYVNSLARRKQTLDAGYDIVTLGLSLAGTLVGGVQSKENLAAAAALMTGSKIAVDKHFYYEQTLPVLIMAMENRRKEVLLKILKGRQSPYNFYPMAQAQTDLADYEGAGSLHVGLRTLTTQAGTRQGILDEQLSSLTPATSVQIKAARDVNLVIAEIVKRKDLAEINRVLKGVGAKKYDYSLSDEAAKALETAFRQMTPEDTPKWKSFLNL